MAFINPVKICYRVKNKSGKVIQRTWSVCYTEDDEGHHIPTEQQISKDIMFFNSSPANRGNIIQVVIDGDVVKEVLL